MPLEAGAKFGPYAIVAPISSGNDGDVYKASDTRLNRAVAIRMLWRRSFCRTESIISTSPSA